MCGKIASALEIANASAVMLVWWVKLACRVVACATDGSARTARSNAANSPEGIFRGADATLSD